MARIDGLSSKRRPEMLNEDILLGIKLLEHKDVYIANDALLTIKIILPGCFPLYFKYSNKCTAVSQTTQFANLYILQIPIIPDLLLLFC